MPRRWKSFAFRVLEMADAQECTVCMSDLADGSSVTSLPCGHTFHGYCLGQISQAKGIAVTDGSFECPTCRMTNAQATAAEMALSGAAAPASGAAAAAAPAPASVPVLVPAEAAAPPAAAKAPAPPPPDAASAAAAWAYMESVGSASLVTMANLEAQQKDLLLQKKALTKQIRLKKVRDERLMSKAAKNLTAAQLLELASKKSAAEKAKASAKSKAKSKAKAKAKA